MNNLIHIAFINIIELFRPIIELHTISPNNPASQDYYNTFTGTART